jgi:hypothetical protein
MAGSNDALQAIFYGENELANKWIIIDGIQMRILDLISEQDGLQRLQGFLNDDARGRVR